jgi:hypothetical protein
VQIKPNLVCTCVGPFLDLQICSHITAALLASSLGYLAPDLRADLGHRIRGICRPDPSIREGLTRRREDTRSGRNTVEGATARVILPDTPIHELLECYRRSRAVFYSFAMVPEAYQDPEFAAYACFHVPSECIAACMPPAVFPEVFQRVATQSAWRGMDLFKDARFAAGLDHVKRIHLNQLFRHEDPKVRRKTRELLVILARRAGAAVEKL